MMCLEREMYDMFRERERERYVLIIWGDMIITCTLLQLEIYTIIDLLLPFQVAKSCLFLLKERTFLRCFIFLTCNTSSDSTLLTFVVVRY